MGTTIEQTITFSNTTPEQLYLLYADQRLHADAIGGPVEMGTAVGARFSAYGGVVGANVVLDAPHRIVQTWRANVWQPSDPDSVLILTFAASGSSAQVHLVQAGVPEHCRKIIDRGWREQYWKKWAAHLKVELSVESRLE